MSLSRSPGHEALRAGKGEGIIWRYFGFYPENIVILQKIPDEKKEQELKSLKKIGDSFRKIVILGDDIATYTNEDGIIFMGLYQFLLNNDILK